MTDITNLVFSRTQPLREEIDKLKYESVVSRSPSGSGIPDILIKLRRPYCSTESRSSLNFLFSHFNLSISSLTDWQRHDRPK
jgi:hypothetical protein